MQKRNQIATDAMLWLIVFLFWAFRTAINGYAGGQPAMRVLLLMLAILGILQVIISVIDTIQYFESRWLDYNRKANPAAKAPMMP